jgi:hypothetical protein
MSNDTQNFVPSYEPNQVLTSGHLNHLRIYLDEQDRIFTRRKLIGIGISCGFHINFDSTSGDKKISITNGTGITSDGFVICLEEDKEYCFYKEYEDVVEEGTGPWKNLVQGDLLELLPADHDEEAGTAFPLATLNDINDKVVVLYLECKTVELDTCMGAENCDDLGHRIVFTIRPLLIDRAKLLPVIVGSVAQDQDRIRIKRLEEGLRTLDTPIRLCDVVEFEQLTDAYKDIIGEYVEHLQIKIQEALDAHGHLIGLVYDDLEDKLNDFVQTQNALKNSNPFGLQYQHDHLKDIIKAFNEFLEYIVCMKKECGLGGFEFEKHLMLGQLVPEAATEIEEYRHYFIKAPIMDHEDKRCIKARQLFKRIVALLDCYELILENSLPIKITPSKEDEYELGMGAIPFYYAESKFADLAKIWNPWATYRGFFKENQSYHATGTNYQATIKDYVTNPLDYNLDRHPFYRIEGVVGKSKTVAVQELIRIRHIYNLAFCLVTLKIDALPSFQKPTDGQKGIDALDKFLRLLAFTKTSETLGGSGTLTATISDDITGETTPPVADNITTGITANINDNTEVKVFINKLKSNPEERKFFNITADELVVAEQEIAFQEAPIGEAKIYYDIRRQHIAHNLENDIESNAEEAEFFDAAKMPEYHLQNVSVQNLVIQQRVIDRDVYVIEIPTYEPPVLTEPVVEIPIPTFPPEDDRERPHEVLNDACFEHYQLLYTTIRSEVMCTLDAIQKRIILIIQEINANLEDRKHAKQPFLYDQKLFSYFSILKRLYPKYLPNLPIQFFDNDSHLITDAIVLLEILLEEMLKFIPTDSIYGAIKFHLIYILKALEELSEYSRKKKALAIYNRFMHRFISKQIGDISIFTNFTKKFSGAEHLAGVKKGGTFILACVDDVVVADFALPYDVCCDCCCEYEIDVPDMDLPPEAPPVQLPPPDEVPPSIFLDPPVVNIYRCEEVDVNTGVTVSDDRGPVNYTTIPAALDTSVAGQFEVKYIATDLAGNEFIATRIYVIAEHNGPQLLIEPRVVIVECDQPDDLKVGVLGVGVKGNNLPVEITDIEFDDHIPTGEDRPLPGTYKVHYKVIGLCDIEKTGFREYTFVDVKPTLTILPGRVPVPCEGIEEYTTGVIATQYDGSAGIVEVDAPTIDTDTPGEYTVVYTVEGLCGDVVTGERIYEVPNREVTLTSTGPIVGGVHVIDVPCDLAQFSVWDTLVGTIGDETIAEADKEQRILIVDGVLSDLDIAGPHSFTFELEGECDNSERITITFISPNREVSLTTSTASVDDIPCGAADTANFDILATLTAVVAGEELRGQAKIDAIVLLEGSQDDLSTAGQHDIIFQLEGPCGDIDEVTVSFFVPDTDVTLITTTETVDNIPCNPEDAANFDILATLTATVAGEELSGQAKIDAIILVSGSQDDLSTEGSHDITFQLEGPCGDSEEVTITFIVPNTEVTLTTSATIPEQGTKPTVDGLPCNPEDPANFDILETLTATIGGVTLEGEEKRNAIALIEGSQDNFSTPGSHNITFQVDGPCSNSDVLVITFIVPDTEATLTTSTATVDDLPCDPSDPDNFDILATLTATIGGEVLQGETKKAAITIIEGSQNDLSTTGSHEIRFQIEGPCGSGEDVGVIFIVQDTEVTLITTASRPNEGANPTVNDLPCNASDPDNFDILETLVATVGGEQLEGEAKRNAIILVSGSQDDFDEEGSHDITFRVDGPCGNSEEVTITFVVPDSEVTLTTTASRPSEGSNPTVDDLPCDPSDAASFDILDTLTATVDGEQLEGAAKVAAIILVNGSQNDLATEGSHDITFRVDGPCGSSEEITITFIVPDTEVTLTTRTATVDDLPCAPSDPANFDILETLTATVGGEQLEGEEKKAAITLVNGSQDDLLEEGSHDISFQVNGDCGDSDLVTVTFVVPDFTPVITFSHIGQDGNEVIIPDNQISITPAEVNGAVERLIVRAVDYNGNILQTQFVSSNLVPELSEDPYRVVFKAEGDCEPVVATLFVFVQTTVDLPDPSDLPIPDPPGPLNRGAFVADGITNSSTEFFNVLELAGEVVGSDDAVVKAGTFISGSQKSVQTLNTAFGARIKALKTSISDADDVSAYKQLTINFVEAYFFKMLGLREATQLPTEKTKELTIEATIMLKELGVDINSLRVAQGGITDSFVGFIKTKA